MSGQACTCTGGQLSSRRRSKRVSRRDHSALCGEIRCTSSTVEALAPDAQIWIYHSLSHFGATLEQRRTFQEQLRGAGFGAGGEVSAVEEVTGDGYWHHYSYTRISASVGICREMDRTAAQIAAAYLVRYDEWGVARDTPMRKRHRARGRVLNLFLTG